MKEAQTSDVFLLINKAIDRVAFEYNFTVGLYYFCMLVIVFYIAKIAIDALISGGEPFRLSDLKKPLFIMGMVIAFPFLENGVRNFGADAFQYQISVNQEKLQGENEKVYADALANRKEIKKQILKIKKKHAKELGVWDRMVFYMSNADDDLMESVFDNFYSFLTSIDYFIYICFAIVSAIWLKILGLGGAIAFTMSLISGGWNVFISWIKTYISVSLWVVVAGLVLTLVNSIGTEIVDYFMQDYANMMIIKNLSIDNYVASVAVSSSMILDLIVISLVLIIVKLILISKVPAMINAMIPGGGSAGSGLSAAFVPISIAKNVTQAVATSGASVAGKAAKGLKKQ